jgi:predicted dehydrogenase
MNDSDSLRVAFIGAGNVNFGGGEGPWDHASRLEQIDGLEVVGVADPDTKRAARALAVRSHPMFRSARVFPDVYSLIAEVRPQAVWIGVPPSAHGTTEPGRDVEAACARAGIHMFIEKPLSAAPPDDVRSLAGRLASQDVIVSVGYMFRYSCAIERMRAILDADGVTPRLFIGRYDCAYSEIRKREWWDARTSGGPVVEQMTHFADLARYLCGEVRYDTIAARTIPANCPAGALSDMPVDSAGLAYDQGVPDAYRAPRATTAVWCFESGALGSLTHAVLLHEKRYDAALEVWADGLLMQLLDPYGDPVVRVRHPHSENYEDVSCSGDDPYLTEDRAFVHAVRTGDVSSIRSSYADALRTFELTWKIAAAGQPE